MLLGCSGWFSAIYGGTGGGYFLVNELRKKNMAKIFSSQNATCDDPAIFSTPGKYAMETAVELLSKIEEEGCYEIENDSWKSSGYGNLVEIGIDIYFENIVFRIMCSYENIFIHRISGNKKKFYDFCNKIREMDFTADS